MTTSDINVVQVLRQSITQRIYLTLWYVSSAQVATCPFDIFYKTILYKHFSNFSQGEGSFSTV